MKCRVRQPLTLAIRLEISCRFPSSERHGVRCLFIVKHQFARGEADSWLPPFFLVTIARRSWFDRDEQVLEQ
jgi:hypothetical protein